MNWKINYWTLLSILLVAGWGSTLITACEPTPPTNAAGEQPMVTCPAIDEKNVLTKQEGRRSIADYRRYKFKFAPDTTATLLNTLSVANLNTLQSFKLPKNELQAMLCLVPDGTVYANLALRPNDISGTDREYMISLVFSDTPPDAANNFAGNTQFFDFTKPCPPCDPG